MTHWPRCPPRVREALMSDHALTTALIRGAFARSDLPGTYAEKRAMFRRWLTQVRAP